MDKAQLIAAARAAQRRHIRAKRAGRAEEAAQWARLRDSHMRWARIK